MKYKKIIACLVFGVLFSQIISCSNIVVDIEKNLKNDNYGLIVKEVLLLNDEEKEQVYVMILNKAKEIETKFNSKEIDGTLAISNLQKLKTISNSSEEIDNIIKQIQSLNNSRKAYLNGVRFEKENNLKESVNSFSLVDKNDNENYESAINSIERISQNLKNEEKLEVVKTSVMRSSKSGSIYNNTVQIILKNKSNKNIKDVNITFIGEDSNKNRIEFNNSEGKVYYFYGSLQDVDIANNTTWGANNSWNVKSNGKIQNISACIESIVYKDGSKWENPLYDLWINNNKVE